MGEQEQKQAIIDGLLADREALTKALSKYTDCRHACQNCFCTLEARAAMFPYLRRERMLGSANTEAAGKEISHDG